jgi:hypothetical protein
MAQFKVGDLVTIQPKKKDLASWNGYVAKVVDLRNGQQPLLRGLAPRPDKINAEFYWPTNELAPLNGFVDLVGRTVHPGDRIAYPARWGSSLWMNTGVVKEIVNPLEHVRVRKDDSGRLVNVRRLANVVKI